MDYKPGNVVIIKEHGLIQYNQPALIIGFFRKPSDFLFYYPDIDEKYWTYNHYILQLVTDQAIIDKVKAAYIAHQMRE